METYLNIRVKKGESCTNACAKCDRRHVVNTRMRKHDKNISMYFRLQKMSPKNETTLF